MLPHFVMLDWEDVLDDLRRHQLRFPDGLVRTALRVPISGHRHSQPAWHPSRVAARAGAVERVRGGLSGASTARNVDSSVERLQVKVAGLVDSRFVLLCNGRRVPLYPAGRNGEFVAGVRYRAWQPPQCLHPNIPVFIRRSSSISSIRGRRIPSEAAHITCRTRADVPTSGFL